MAKIKAYAGATVTAWVKGKDSRPGKEGVPVEVRLYEGESSGGSTTRYQHVPTAWVELWHNGERIHGKKYTGANLKKAWEAIGNAYRMMKERGELVDAYAFQD